jgi:hypothetical protein
MQNSGHNLGFDVNGNLLFVREPMSEEDRNAGYTSLVPDSSHTNNQQAQRQKLSHYLNQALKAKFEVASEEDFMKFLYGFIAEKMSFLGFNTIESIAPEEQRWLVGHNI